MQKSSALWRFVTAVLFLCMSAYVLPVASDTGRVAEDPATQVAELEGHPSAKTEDCMACHGPIDVWKGLAQDFVSPSGVPVNPHITFDKTNPAHPHASGEGVMDCAGCHQPHPIPLVSPLPDANIDQCVACHHTGTFRACSDCH